ncbi:MAG: hypothetical protein DI543_26180 [Bradyrhizobium icense]|nr:MAG: hypothetical protein DI543_26180 [Bradyrhizobium icense]
MVAMLVAMSAAVAMGLSFSEPVSSGALGPDWQCARLAFVFTSCTRVVRLKTAAAEEAGKTLSCPRPALWRKAIGFLR